jgi:hypothetical protein
MGGRGSSHLQVLSHTSVRNAGNFPIRKAVDRSVIRNQGRKKYVIYFSMALPAHSGPWPLIQFRNHFSQKVGRRGRVISSSQSLYLNTGQTECLSALDRPSTMIGRFKNYFIEFLIRKCLMCYLGFRDLVLPYGDAIRTSRCTFQSPSSSK